MITVSPSRLKNYTALMLIVGLTSCSKRVLYKQTVTPQAYPVTAPSSAKPPVTVWVHGTTNNALIKKIHAAPLGMHRAQQLSNDYHLKTVAQQLTSLDPARFDFNHFYMFGWSGHLSFEARKQAARELYTALKKIRHEYCYRYGTEPKICIITHSHGGNVALNLARVKEPTDTALNINELVLLASPVQQATSHYIEDPIFKKVFSLYSDLDILQLADPQGLYAQSQASLTAGQEAKLFSEREFEQHPKLVQAKLKYQGRALLHLEFIFNHIVKALPAILRELETWHQEKLVLNHPTNAEYLIKIT